MNLSKKFLLVLCGIGVTALTYAADDKGKGNEKEISQVALGGSWLKNALFYGSDILYRSNDFMRSYNEHQQREAEEAVSTAQEFFKSEKMQELTQIAQGGGSQVMQHVSQNKTLVPIGVAVIGLASGSSGMATVGCMQAMIPVMSTAIDRAQVRFNESLTDARGLVRELNDPLEKVDGIVTNVRGLMATKKEKEKEKEKQKECQAGVPAEDSLEKTRRLVGEFNDPLDKANNLVDRVTQLVTIMDEQKKAKQEARQEGAPSNDSLDKTSSIIQNVNNSLDRVNGLLDRTEGLLRALNTTNREVVQNNITHLYKALIQGFASVTSIGIGGALVYKNLMNYEGRKSAHLAAVGAGMMMAPITAYSISEYLNSRPAIQDNVQVNNAQVNQEYQF